MGADCVGEAAGEAPGMRVGEGLGDPVTGELVGSRLGDSVGDGVGDGVGVGVGEGVGEGVGRAVGDSVGGWHVSATSEHLTGQFSISRAVCSSVKNMRARAAHTRCDLPLPPCTAHHAREDVALLVPRPAP